MTIDQARNLAQVYRELMDIEHGDWDEVDEYISLLDELDTNQIHREADVVLEQHSRGNPRCPVDHPDSECFIPSIIEAVTAILDLYKEENYMHKNNEYILKYYLAITHAGTIICD